MEFQYDRAWWHCLNTTVEVEAINKLQQFQGKQTISTHRDLWQSIQDPSNKVNGTVDMVHLFIYR